ncbi:hypothetical protein F0562_034861 [Nyssa sinensis]|uniref:Uncharacterized protein n=1 Tax=Nyssa sinensis TaxID=561372 RepID=A0A5J5AB03_9ASTE|nr:hypothetical protein F0562_034861 [Nyssa sinensis]
MVGDIFGKSWGSSAPSSTTSSIGIVNKNPNLFGDLVSSALGQNRGNTNVPLKNATLASTPASNKSAYSTGNLADSLPKASNSSNVNSVKSANLGVQSKQSGDGGGLSSNKDPFGSLVDFGSKPAVNLNSVCKSSNKPNSGDDAFGDFQNASKSSTPTSTSNAFPANKNNTIGSNYGAYSKIDDFGIPTSDNHTPARSSGVDAFDVLFSSSSVSVGAAPKGSEGLESQQFSETEDWGLDSEPGGNDTGGTTELDGLPPPPAGVSASAAKNKGMDNQKQGQYADAIKWLSWAVILLEKAGDDAATMEVLSCRASCYKEVGEYKKAVADCTKVLEYDSTSVAALVQRALLYESTEKYKLGAEDLRTVMKLDPGNRVARSTIHRLTKMAN